MADSRWFSTTPMSKSHENPANRMTQYFCRHCQGRSPEVSNIVVVWEFPASPIHQTNSDGWKIRMKLYLQPSTNFQACIHSIHRYLQLHTIIYMLKVIQNYKTLPEQPVQKGSELTALPYLRKAYLQG